MNSSSIIRRIWSYSHVLRDAGVRQAVLKKAFCVRLVSQDPNDELAGELLARMRAVA